MAEIGDTAAEPVTLPILCGSRAAEGGEAAEQQRDQGLALANRQAMLAALISGAVHEINNPNNNILLASRLLGDYWKQLAPLLKEYQAAHPEAVCAGMPVGSVLESMPRIFAMIAEDVGRISRITGELKAFANEEVVPGQQLDVNAVIRSTAELMKGLLVKRTRHFTLELAEDLPRLAFDPCRLRQVMANLICNALQSLPDRERVVSVSTRHDRPIGAIVIAIRDEGHGIATELAPLVFKPFFSTRTAEGRAGLGLYVSRQIVEECGGTLMLESEPGQGTVATITLPC